MNLYYYLLFAISGTLAILSMLLFDKLTPNKEKHLRLTNRRYVLFIVGWWLGGALMFVFSVIIRFLMNNS